MSEFTVSGALMLDMEQAWAELRAFKEAADKQTLQWKVDRNTLLRQIREGFTMISSLMASFRQMMSVFGQSVDPFFSALIGMVLAMASLLISSATTLAATVVGGPLAAIIFGLAVGFQIIAIGKLVADKQKTDDIIGSMMQAISKTGESRAWGFS